MQSVDDLGPELDAVAGQQDFHFAAREAETGILLSVLLVPVSSLKTEEIPLTVSLLKHVANAAYYIVVALPRQLGNLTAAHGYRSDGDNGKAGARCLRWGMSGCHLRRSLRFSTKKHPAPPSNRDRSIADDLR